MAVIYSLEFANIGMEKYDAVMKELGLDKKDAKWPKGVISHAAGKTSNGMCVVDVWESEEAFGQFREKQLNPAFQKVGGIPEPRITTAKLHNRYPAR